MSNVRPERLTAGIDGNVVAFLICLRINTLRKPHKWMQVVAAMPRMLAELARTPPFGLGRPVNWRPQWAARHPPKAGSVNQTRAIRPLFDAPASACSEKSG